MTPNREGYIFGVRDDEGLNIVEWGAGHVAINTVTYVVNGITLLSFSCNVCI